MPGAGRTRYTDLGIYSDWVAAARGCRDILPANVTACDVRTAAREVLGFTLGDEQPIDLRVERRWQGDGIEGEEVSWSVGFGPRTLAWVVRPAGAHGRLPAVVALHDHSHFKYFGKEKIADGPDPVQPAVQRLRAAYYGGRDYVAALARRGYVVLAHDVFLWGSRRFPLETMPEMERALAEPAGRRLGLASVEDPEIALYNGAAYLHEHLVEKYCTLLGTSFADVVAYEDRVALAYLGTRADVDPDRRGCLGLSGGGCRAAMLQATSDDVAAAAIAGMMCTYDELLDHDVAPHTWMFFPAGWSRRGDWPDLAAARAPSPLLVQFLLDDPQFTVDGMRAADARMAAHYAAAGAPDAHRGIFYPGPHRFDREMQEACFDWLDARLGRG